MDEEEGKFPEYELTYVEDEVGNSASDRPNMDTRSKLKEARYFLGILAQVQDEPDKFRFNLSAFLTAWRSVLDVMLYDFAVLHSVGFTRDVEMSHKEFYAVAEVLNKTEATRFLRWWRKKQGMLSNSPLWKKRRINVHRGYPSITQTYDFYVSGSGGTSGTISPYVESVRLPLNSTLGTLVPQTPPIAVGESADWQFSDFPNESVVDMCTKAYNEMEKIVVEAEREFSVQL